MNGTLQPMLGDTLEYLMTLSREGVRPKDARVRFHHLQQQYPDVEMELLWEEEAYDRSVHYDALLRLTRAGTVSLSFCPDRALPWPLRGVHRWSDKDLVRVNNTVLQVDQAIACLDFIWDEARILNRLVNVCLIQAALEKEPVELSDAELQRAVDGFRRTHRLYTTQDTHRWMEQRGLTYDQFEQLVMDQALVAKLRERVTKDRVDAYFADHRADFDTACIARFECPDEASARRTCEQIRRGEVDFFETAQRQFLAATEGSKVLFAVIQRGAEYSDLHAAVFAAAPGEVVGPLHTEAGYAIIRVLSFMPARLDEQTRGAIQKILFETWLTERRQAATIEWYWGDASRTSQRA